MTTIFSVEEPNNDGIVLMKDMEPCQIGVVVDGMCEGHFVMRTANSDKFEVMDLTKCYPNSCWDMKENNTISVRLLKPGTKITLIVEEIDHERE